MSLKRKDSYHFTIPFEYIQKNHGNDNYDIAVANMEVDVQWNNSEEGYEISYYVPDMDLIDPTEGNGDEEEIYESTVEEVVLSELASMGIYPEALIGGTGTW